MNRAIRSSTLIVLLLSLILSGCASLPSSFLTEEDAETLTSWSFQYNEGTDDYSVFFCLLNRQDKPIAVDVDAHIRIVDENENELYSAIRSVTKEDYGYYTSRAAGEQYLANIRIKSSEIAEGTSVKGTLYLTIYQGDSLWFDEVNCQAYYLPLKNVTLQAESLPVELPVKGYGGETVSVIRVDEVAYTYEKSISPRLSITLIGAKTYAKEDAMHISLFDTISYKLYDSGGYLVDSGNVYLSSLAVGDKFKDDSIVFFDIIPGEAYTLKLVEYNG